jgi:hypothetical protein
MEVAMRQDAGLGLTQTGPLWGMTGRHDSGNEWLFRVWKAVIR